MLSENRQYAWINIFLSFMIAMVTGFIVIMASVPPVSRDALTHHLFIPKLYFLKGGIYEIPHIIFSYYPMNLELLYSISLYFNNDIVPKLMHFAFAIATAAMIFRYLTLRMNKQYALLGALFFISIPVIVTLSTTVYVDLGLVCFIFAAMMYLFKWIENNFKLNYLLISAVYCGLALGTKYNGLVGFFLLGMFVPYTYSKYHSDKPFHTVKAIGYAAIYIVTALIIFSPWMIRNVIWTGNPVYPLYNSVFNPESSSVENFFEDDAELPPDISHFRIRRQLYGESGWEIALIPLRVFFQGQDGNPKYFDGKANPFLLLLPFFAFWGIRSSPRQLKTEKFLMLWFSILFLLFAFVQRDIRIRYFAPIFAPLTILAMFGLRRIHEKGLIKSFGQSFFVKQLIVFSIIFIMLLLNAKYLLERYHYVQPLRYLTGSLSREEYIQRFRPEYASMQYANRNLTDKDCILGVYIGNRGYYSDIKIMFSLSLLQGLAKKAEFPSDVATGLKKYRITHLLVNFEMFNFRVHKYSMHEKLILKDFFQKYTVTEFSKDGYGLLEVKC